MDCPRIGITIDNQDRTAASGQYRSAIAYSEAIARVGGLPLLLPQLPALAHAYVEACDGLLLTGGADPATEPFGEPTDVRARLIEPSRQAFELALLDAAGVVPDKPVLGICLGMQMMALHANGRLNQYLPDTLTARQAEAHRDNRLHEVAIDRTFDHPLGTGSDQAEPDPCMVVSSHRQAVASPGRLTVIGQALDGTIEAIIDPQRTFYVGVQWHPERAADAYAALNRRLLERFVAASR